MGRIDGAIHAEVGFSHVVGCDGFTGRNRTGHGVDAGSTPKEAAEDAESDHGRDDRTTPMMNRRSILPGARAGIDTEAETRFTLL